MALDFWTRLAKGTPASATESAAPLPDQRASTVVTDGPPGP
jgi:hypothetical protein